jgi:hypothetical protein
MGTGFLTIGEGFSYGNPRFEVSGTLFLSWTLPFLFNSNDSYIF